MSSWSYRVTLVSRETTRQIIPAAYTRWMHEFHALSQVGGKDSYRVQRRSQDLAGRGLILSQSQEAIRHAKLRGRSREALTEDLGSQESLTADACG